MVKKMKPSTNGHTQPDMVKLGLEETGEIPKRCTRTYQNPNGESFSLTEEEFCKVIELFAFLRKSRDEKVARADTFEPEICAQTEETEVEEREVG